MATLSQIKNNTKWNESATTLNENFNKINVELKKLSSMTVNNLGYYKSESDLPLNVMDNSVAYINETLNPPFSIWVFKNGKWQDSGFTYTQQIQLGDYYTRTECDEKNAEIHSQITGDSATNSNGFEYPFVFLGNFADYTRLIAELDKLHSTDNTSQTVGDFRVAMNGNLLYVTNYVRSWADEDFIQYIEGTIKLLENGSLGVTTEVGKFTRRYSGGAWSAWQIDAGQYVTQEQKLEVEGKVTELDFNLVTDGFYNSLTCREVGVKTYMQIFPDIFIPNVYEDTLGVLSIDYINSTYGIYIYKVNPENGFPISQIDNIRIDEYNSGIIIAKTTNGNYIAINFDLLKKEYQDSGFRGNNDGIFSDKVFIKHSGLIDTYIQYKGNNDSIFLLDKDVSKIQYIEDKVLSKSDTETVGILNSRGEVDSNYTKFKCSDFIELKHYDTIQCENLYSSSGDFIGLGLYDKDELLIKGFGTNDSINLNDYPNAFYCRFVTTNDKDNERVSLSQRNTTAYRSIKNESDIATISKSLETISVENLVNQDTLYPNKYCFANVGSKITTSANDNYIALIIPVKPNTIYSLNFSFQSVFCYFLDAEQRCIATFKNEGVADLANNVVTIDGCYWIGLSFYTSPTNASKLVAVEDFLSQDMLNIDNYPQGKKIIDVFTKAEVLERYGEGTLPDNSIVLKVGLDYSAESEGWGQTVFSSLLDAFNSIPKNSGNKYRIEVEDGTYTDMQTRYAGDSSSTYQGVLFQGDTNNIEICSASNDPTKCILEWDGHYGFSDDDTFNDKIQAPKCFFHINGGTGNVIKGFTLRGKNMRYCLHSEANWNTSCRIENMILDWANRPDVSDNPKGTIFGIGGGYYCSLDIIECEFKNDGYEGSDLAIQWHDNIVPHELPLFPIGARITCTRCLFNNLYINPRSTQPNRRVPFVLELNNCGEIAGIRREISGDATHDYWAVVNNGSIVGSAENH